MTTIRNNIWGAVTPLITTLVAVFTWLGYDFYLSPDKQFKAEQYEDQFELEWILFYVTYVISLILVSVFATKQIIKGYRTWVYYAIVSSILMTAVPILYLVVSELLQTKPFSNFHPIELLAIIFIVLIFHIVIWIISVYLINKKIEIRNKNSP